MLDSATLALAIDIQARSFKLLRWINEQIEKKRLPVGQAANHSNTPDAAIDWVREYYYLLPEEARPNPTHLLEFAQFFWTYILTSFDVIEKPGVSIIYLRKECHCFLCSRIQYAPYLQPKKLTPRDKRRAEELMTERMEQLAREEGTETAPGAIPLFLKEPEMRRAAGYSAYGLWLINRMQGITDGPSILALWREIAWNKLGSPIKEFKLRCEDFLYAENRLIQVFRTVPANTQN